MLVVGGTAASYSLASCEFFNGSTWTITGSLHTPRDSHRTILLNNGKVLAIAGTNNTPSTGVFLTSCELYDPSTGLWTVTGSLNTSHGFGFTATLLNNGNVLVTGGYDINYYPNGDFNTCEIYDSTTGIWTVISPLNIRRSSHSAVRLADGKVLVAGGQDSSFNYTTSCEIFDGSIWTLTADLNDGRAAVNGELNMLLLQNNTALIIGVYDNIYFTPSCEIFTYILPHIISLSDSVSMDEIFFSESDIWTKADVFSAENWTNKDGTEPV
jgi:hypothetical protein